MNSSSPTHQEIAEQAYQIYVRNGRKDGQSLDHWLQAESELTKSRDGAGKPAAATPRGSNGGAKTTASAKTTTSAKAAPTAAAANSRPPLKKGAKSAK